MKSKAFASRLFGVILLAGIALNVGCEPEMPAPPPKVFASSAEEDFDWAMERLEHAMGLFRPASNLGISVKRELDYELFPPTEEQPKYTARVTISARTVFRVDTPQAEAQKRRAEAKKDSEEIKLDNPFKVPGEENADGLDPDVGIAEIAKPEIVEPSIPTQKLEEKQDYLLEYSGGQWRLVTKDIKESEQMWFDYALQQGDFGPGGSSQD